MERADRRARSCRGLLTGLKVASLLLGLLSSFAACDRRAPQHEISGLERPPSVGTVPAPTHTVQLGKASSQLQFVFQPLGVPRISRVEYKLTVTVAAPCDYVEFSVRVPPGVQILFGPQSWHGAVRDSLDFSYVFSVPDEKRYGIVVGGRLAVSGGQFEGGGSQAVIDLGTPDPDSRAATRLRDARGNSLRNYEVK